MDEQGYFSVLFAALQEVVGSEHVIVAELQRVIKGVLHMALGCKMYDLTDVMDAKKMRKKILIADITLDEGIPRVRAYPFSNIVFAGTVYSMWSLQPIL